MPQLSIILPVYNKEQYIDASINSILNQSFKDFELILVNDGSTDSSGEKCDKYTKMDNRVYTIHQKNNGVSHARNLGLSVAKGSYIGFVDCDDFLELDMYESLMSVALNNKADIAICGVRKILPAKTELIYGTNTTKIYNRVEAISGLFNKEFARSVYDKVYKTEIAKKAKFEGQINEDVFYNFLVLRHADKIIFNDSIKYNYVIRDNSVSMRKFSKKNLDCILFSERMVAICEAEMPELVKEAKSFDFVANISLLNLILISNKHFFYKEYNQVKLNLRKYYLNKDNTSIRIKHKYANQIFNVSPVIYELLMKIYCRLTNAEVSKKI